MSRWGEQLGPDAAVDASEAEKPRPTTGGGLGASLAEPSGERAPGDTGRAPSLGAARGVRRSREELQGVVDPVTGAEEGEALRFRRSLVA